jgi:hypothetical protein
VNISELINTSAEVITNDNLVDTMYNRYLSFGYYAPIIYGILNEGKWGV